MKVACGCAATLGVSCQARGRFRTSISRKKRVPLIPAATHVPKRVLNKHAHVRNTQAQPKKQTNAHGETAREENENLRKKATPKRSNIRNLHKYSSCRNKPSPPAPALIRRRLGYSHKRFQNKRINGKKNVKRVTSRLSTTAYKSSISVNRYT